MRGGSSLAMAKMNKGMAADDKNSRLKPNMTIAIYWDCAGLDLF
jgi:hypothetical protein